MQCVGATARAHLAIAAFELTGWFLRRCIWTLRRWHKTKGCVF